MSKQMVPALVAALCLVFAGEVASQEKVARQAGELIKLLAEEIETKDFQAPNMTLKDYLALLTEKLSAQGREFPILVDSDAFRLENPDTDIYDAQIKFPPRPGRVSLATALRIALQKAPDSNATFLVHPTHILVTTVQRATPERQTVREMFVKRPLEEILQELSAQAGISVVLDHRVGDKAKTVLTAQFRNETSLLTAVRLLADMADLKAVVVENVLYVTSKKNAELGAPPPPGF
jgi:hypothetical protein